MSCLYEQVACCGDGDGGGSATDSDIVAAAVPELLRAIGEDPSRPGLIETPKVSDLCKTSMLADDPADCCARRGAISYKSLRVLTRANRASDSSGTALHTVQHLSGSLKSAHRSICGVLRGTRGTESKSSYVLAR